MQEHQSNGEFVIVMEHGGEKLETTLKLCFFKLSKGLSFIDLFKYCVSAEFSSEFESRW